MDFNESVVNKVQSGSISMLSFLFLKRCFDIGVSLIGSVFLFLLIGIVKLIYIIGGDFAPIMFKHDRIGKNGKGFKMYKFRTMIPNAPEVLEDLLKNNKEMAKEWQENHKIDNDPRITKIGKILRKCSIDEVPQFINILIGDMSFIGPRPLVQEEVDEYGKDKDKLLSVRPGLTGYWACNGRSNVSPLERKKLELYYIDHCSIILDIKIFFMTIIKVIKKEGAK